MISNTISEGREHPTVFEPLNGCKFTPYIGVILHQILVLHFKFTPIYGVTPLKEHLFQVLHHQSYTGTRCYTSSLHQCRVSHFQFTLVLGATPLNVHQYVVLQKHVTPSCGVMLNINTSPRGNTENNTPQYGVTYQCNTVSWCCDNGVTLYKSVI